METKKVPKSAAMHDKIYEARIMFVVKKLLQKEIALLLDVTEKSVGVWIKKYGWREDRDRALNGNVAIDEFINFLQIKYPMMSASFRMYAVEYYKHQKLVSQFK